MSNIGKDFLVDFIAGFAGGAACVYCGQPLDTVKVKLQTFPSMYRGAFDCFKKTLQLEGVLGLYKGTLPALVCNVSENAVLFPARGIMEKLVASVSNKQEQDLSDFQRACAGSLASIFSSLVVCPTELIKCRMQAMTELQATGKVVTGSIGPWGVLRHMIKTEGIRSPFNGLTSTWAREIPGYYLFFYGYEKTRSLLTPKGKTKYDLGILATMFAGGTAGLFLWIGIFPIDVVKSRIQVLSAAGKQSGFWKTFLTIIRTEGVLRLYNGLLPTVLRTYPANGALMLTMEWTRQWLTNTSLYT